MSDPRIPALREQKRKERSSLIWYNIRAALTGRAGAAPTDNPTTGVQAGYIWVHGADNRPEVPALNPGRVSERASNADVLIGERWLDGMLEVITLEAYLATLRYGGAVGAIATPTVPAELMPFGEKSREFMVVPHPVLGGTWVYVYPGWYNDGKDFFVGGAFDTSSYITATASHQAWLALAFDETAVAVIAETGTDYSLAMNPMPVTDIVTTLASATFADAFGLAAIPVANGATTLPDIGTWEDLRAQFGGSGAGSGLADSPFASRAALTRGPLRLGLDAADVLDRFTTLTASADVSNPVIAVGAAASGQTKIREIGNVLFEPDATTWKYKTCYTGWETSYGVDEKVYTAVSEDGRTWTKIAASISSRMAEDPYLLKVDGVYYLYAEDKTAGGDNRIRRWSSLDFATWSDDGQISGMGDNEQSPVVWVEGDTWYLLYENFPSGDDDLRLATSEDGLTWTDEATNPVAVLGDTAWSSTSLVIDDVLKLGATYYATFHGLSGATWVCGMMKSTTLTSWTDLGTVTSSALGTDIVTLMLAYDGTLWFHFYDTETSGIYRGDPVDPVVTLSSDAFTAASDYYLVAAQTGTSDDLATINGGRHGQLLVLKADSGDTISVKHGTGNLTLNGAADFTLSGDKALVLFFDRVGNKWSDVGAGGGAASYYQTTRDNGSGETQRAALNFLSGTGIAASVADDAGNNESEVTHALAINTLTEDTAPAEDDYVASYDVGSAGHKKILVRRLPVRQRLLFSQVADKTVANTTSETSLIGTGRGSTSVAANDFDIGSQLHIAAGGYVSDTGTPTLTVRLTLGGAEILTTGAVTMPSGVSNVGWSLIVNIICRTTGASGTVVASGVLHYNDGAAKHLVKTTTTTVNTTTALAVDVLATWGTMSASNTITSQTLSIQQWTASVISTGGDTLILESSDSLLLESGDAALLEG